MAPSNPAQAGQCKLSIVVDRSGSMMAPRTDGSVDNIGQPQTRCYAGAVAVSETLDAYVQGDAYDIANTRSRGASVLIAFT